MPSLSESSRFHDSFPAPFTLRPRPHTPFHAPSPAQSSAQPQTRGYTHRYPLTHGQPHRSPRSPSQRRPPGCTRSYPLGVSRGFRDRRAVHRMVGRGVGRRLSFWLACARARLQEETEHQSFSSSRISPRAPIAVRERLSSRARIFSGLRARHLSSPPFFPPSVAPPICPSRGLPIGAHLAPGATPDRERIELPPGLVRALLFSPQKPTTDFIAGNPPLTGIFLPLLASPPCL